MSMQISKSLAFLGAGLLVAGMTTSSNAASLVHHYSFDDLVTGGNATDSVGGATGIWDGDANANIAVAGIIGTASQTNDENGGNGAEHYTIGSLNGIDGATQFSISLWFRQDVDTNNNSNYNGLFMTRNATSQTGGGGENWGIAIENNNSPRHIDWRVDGQAGTETDNIIGNVSNDWNHVAYVYDSTTNTTSLYQNGSLVTSENVGPGVGAIVTGGSWDIGDDACCPSREFTGTLDDISVWTGALTADEVAAIYQGGLQGIDAPNAIPEPASVALLGLGGLMMLRRRKN